MKPQRLTHCIALAGVIASTPALASENYRDEIITTATRTPVALEKSLASVTTISRDDIEAIQPRDLVDVLRLTPSLDISRNGGLGANASLFTRGTASGQTLILVDGQRISSATLGLASYHLIDPASIERIEVVRGAYSSLYGSEAIGGVIQIFTRDGAGETGTWVDTSAGSNNLGKIAAGTSGSHGNLRYGLGLSYLNTDGIDHLVDDTGNNRDDDGYRNRSLNASLGYSFDNGASLDARLLQSDNRFEYDSAFSPASRPYSDTRLQALSLHGRLPVSERWLSQLTLGRNKDDANDYDGNGQVSLGDFLTVREQLFWQNDITVADGHIVTLGYDYYEDKVEGSTDFSEDSRTNKAVLGQYQGGWSIVDLVLGVREDDNQAYGSHTTGNVAVGLQVSDHYRVIASWSEGFKAPTFNDLYWPTGAFSAGNPDLRPEQSENIELGLRGDYSQWYWALTWFDNQVDDLINWAPGDDFVWRPYNVSDAEIEGGEAEIGAALAGWALTAAFTYVEPRDADSDLLLQNRSRSNLMVSASRDFGALSFGLQVKAQDKRYTDAANTMSVGGYATVGATLGYALSPRLDARLKVDNLFDRDYQLANGYHQDGTNWLLGLSYRL